METHSTPKMYTMMTLAEVNPTKSNRKPIPVHIPRMPSILRKSRGEKGSRAGWAGDLRGTGFCC